MIGPEDQNCGQDRVKTHGLSEAGSKAGKVL